MIRDLSDEESRALLRRCRLGRLGCIVDGYPYVVPINYIYDGECVYGHSLPGRKITALTANPNVCLQLDEIVDEYEWRSVLVTGRFEEVTSPHDRSRILNNLLARFPKLTPVETAIAQDAERLPVIVFRIVIEKISGVFES